MPQPTYTQMNTEVRTDLQQKFITFQLGLDRTALLPLESVTELFQLSVSDILPVPEVDSCVLGIYNWREEMLWLVDLNALLGFPPLGEKESLLRSPMTIVIQAKERSLGLVVPQVKDIEVFDMRQLKPPDGGVFTPQLLPFLQGYFVSENNQILPMLNPQAMIQTPVFNADR